MCLLIGLTRCSWKEQSAQKKHNTQKDRLNGTTGTVQGGSGKGDQGKLHVSKTWVTNLVFFLTVSKDAHPGR